jgi:hypothetical protein
MKIKKLLKIVLVASSYIVVQENGQNQRIALSDTSGYQIGDMYEIENIIEEKKEVKPARKFYYKEEEKEEKEQKDWE